MRLGDSRGRHGPAAECLGGFMAPIAPLAFILTTALCSLYFLFYRRRFDLLSIAWLGALYYFSPLINGRVIKLGPDLDTSIPTQVYLIAATYMLGLIVGGIASSQAGRSAQIKQPTSAPSLSGWLLLLGLAGLVGAFVTSEGEILNEDKVQVLQQVGYWYALFEISTCLACIASAQERRWRRLACGALLLAIDLLVGFRVFVVLTALSVALVTLGRSGEIRLYTKAFSYGIAAALLVVSMLLVHSARSVIFDRVAWLRNGSDSAQASTLARPLRGDTLQYIEAFDEPTIGATALSKALNLPKRMLHLYQRTEPYVIQAILVETIRSDLTCKPINVLKSLYLLAPPGVSRILSNPFPPTFYDEYQPTLFPAVTYGLGGNIWSEMLCRFGYLGDLAFGVFLITILVGLQRLLLSVPAPIIAPLVFGGVILAFFIHRNDAHYTLVLLRQTAMVFLAAYILAYTYSAISAGRLTKFLFPSFKRSPEKQLSGSNTIQPQ